MRSVVVLLLLCACWMEVPLEFTLNELDTTVHNDDGTVQGDGRIVYLEFEGGFYGIVADGDGSKYYPLSGVGSDFEQDGLEVAFKLKPRPDVATIVMWGTPVDIVELQRK